MIGLGDCMVWLPTLLTLPPGRPSADHQPLVCFVFETFGHVHVCSINALRAHGCQVASVAS